MPHILGRPSKKSRQFGFGLLLYGFMALAILGALGGIGYSIRKAGADAVRAELEPKLKACETLTAGLSAQVKAQNEAVEALRADAARRADKARRALASAETVSRGLESEAAHLKAVLASKGKEGRTCEKAWEAIRKPS